MAAFDEYGNRAGEPSLLGVCPVPALEKIILYLFQLLCCPKKEENSKEAAAASTQPIPCNTLAHSSSSAHTGGSPAPQEEAADGYVSFSGTQFSPHIPRAEDNYPSFLPPPLSTPARRRQPRERQPQALERERKSGQRGKGGKGRRRRRRESEREEKRSCWRNRK